MKQILLECPTCHQGKLQKLPPELMKKRQECKNGILTILIPENTICAHLFLVYLDQNLSVRDTVPVLNAGQYNKKEVINVNDIDDLIKTLRPDKIKSILTKL